MNGKSCIVCNKWYDQSKFTYGNRDNNSYCITCARTYGKKYTEGGTMATQRWLELMRSK